MSNNVALAMPTLFASSTRPVTFTVERLRVEAIRIASSSVIGRLDAVVSGFGVSGFGVSTGDGSGVGDVSGVGVGAAAAAVGSLVGAAGGGAAEVSAVAVVMNPPP